MHMSCHLKECILDYGPLNHFWLFAFERFNGILGNLPNNNRSIEVQMAKRFISDSNILRMPLPSEFKEDFRKVALFQQQSVGSLGEDVVLSPEGLSEKPCSYTLPHSFVRCVFNSYEFDKVKETLSAIYPANDQLELAIDISKIYQKYSFITFNEKVYGNYKSRSKNSSIVLAEFKDEAQPARINFFAKVSASVNGAQNFYVLVCLNWFARHIKVHACGNPVTVWHSNLFDMYNFMPLDSIKSRTVSVVSKLDDTTGNVLFVSPYL